MNAGDPLVYRLKASIRYFYGGLGILILAIALVAVVYFGFLDDGFDSANTVIIVIAVPFAALGAYVSAGALRTRVILNADSIEVRGVFLERSLERINIEGVRHVPMQHGPPLLRLERRDDIRPLSLPQHLAVDDAFARWFETIEDLDAKEQQASLDEMLADSEIEGSRDEKLAGLERARKIAQGLRYATFGVGAWGWFAPNPYDLVVGMLVVLPWVAVVLAVRGGKLYKLNPSRNDVAADLSATLYLPGFVLMIRAILDVSVLDWQSLLGMTAAGAAVCLLIIVTFVRELRHTWKGMAAIAALMCAYSYGGLALANSELDETAPEVFPVQVLDEHVSSGKTTTYEMKLAAWGPRTEAADVTVEREFYESTRPGDTVCVYLWPGALKVRWFAAGRCPRG